MAMNNSNFGYPPSGFSSPYPPTPTGMRTQRPRFGYSGPSLYPRPRSSASKPNPDSFSDSMINNYGNSPSRINTSFSSQNGNTFNDSYHNASASDYYSANDTFYSPDSGPLRNSNIMRNDTAMVYDNTMMYNDNMQYKNNVRGDKSSTPGDVYSTGILSNPASQYGPPKNFYNNSYGLNNREFKGSFQKNTLSQFSTETNKAPSFAARKFGKAKRRMATKPGTWRCALCSLDFTSQIPYDMHFRGARHAKKLKANEALNIVQSQVTTLDGEKGFFCELCNVKANSSLQLQTHLEGNKHKGKLLPKEAKEKPQDGIKAVAPDTLNESVKSNSLKSETTNGSLTRPLPSDFGEPQPTKLTKYACDICNLSVNSEIQLQQHLTSKKHQFKVEGKPLIRGKKNKMQENKDTALETEATNAEPGQASNETSKMVVGVKTLASSFIQGGTLQ